MQHTEAWELGWVSGRPVDDDRHILERIAAGERGALAELYERYRRPIFSYLCQLTSDYSVAEEILQDTLVAVWKGASSFAGRSTIQTWLIGIARRQAHNSMRRRRLPLADLSDGLDVADPEPEPEERTLARMDREELVAALSRLAPIHRDVLVLSFAQGLSYQEIAQVLGVPEGTVKSRLSNAKQSLRALLRAREEVER